MLRSLLTFGGSVARYNGVMMSERGSPSRGLVFSSDYPGAAGSKALDIFQAEQGCFLFRVLLRTLGVGWPLAD